MTMWSGLEIGDAGEVGVQHQNNGRGLGEMIVQLVADPEFHDASLL